MKIKSLGGYFDLDKNTIKVPIFTEQVQVVGQVLRMITWNDQLI